LRRERDLLKGGARGGGTSRSVKRRIGDLREGVEENKKPTESGASMSGIVNRGVSRRRHQPRAL